MSQFIGKGKAKNRIEEALSWEGANCWNAPIGRLIGSILACF